MLFKNIVQTHAVRQPLLCLAESQLLNLARTCSYHCTNGAAWLPCGSARRPAHTCSPNTACPSQGTAPLYAGCDSGQSFLKRRKITEKHCFQAWGLFWCPSHECSNDGMKNYTMLSDFSQMGP